MGIGIGDRMAGCLGIRCWHHSEARAKLKSHQFVLCEWLHVEPELGSRSVEGV